jgi:predicted nucleotidyltransferase
MTRALDLEPHHRTILLELLRAQLPSGVRVWVFGSRATGTARRRSDLDLALEGPEPLDPAVTGELAEALLESDLPYTVDLIDLRTVAPEFRARIGRDCIELPLAREQA